MAQELAAGNVPEACAIRLESVKMHLPMKIGGFADFCCSLQHCKNVNMLFPPSSRTIAPGVLQAIRAK
jgi:fumarylacetoacetase